MNKQCWSLKENGQAEEDMVKVSSRLRINLKKFNLSDDLAFGSEQSVWTNRIHVMLLKDFSIVGDKALIMISNIERCISK